MPLTRGRTSAIRIDVIRPGRFLVNVTGAASTVITPTSGGLDAWEAPEPSRSLHAASVRNETAQIVAPAERINCSLSMKSILLRRRRAWMLDDYRGHRIAEDPPPVFQIVAHQLGASYATVASRRTFVRSS
nr:MULTISPECIES: hypothetical protein [unclassified Bradyrhizobium]